MRSTREVYANHYIRVLEDEVTRPDGSAGMFGLLEVRNPAVFVVPVTADDRVVLVHCDRYTTGTSWEVPAGGSDGQDLRVAGRARAGRGDRVRRRPVGPPGRPVGAQRRGPRRGSRCSWPATLTRTSATYDEGEGIARGGGRSRGTRCATMLRDGSLNDNESAGALLLAAIELGWA